MFLGNFRGTNDSSAFARAFGPAHRSLSPDDPEFFRFSVDDHVLDVMATVDAIRALKRAEIHPQLRAGSGCGAPQRSWGGFGVPGGGDDGSPAARERGTDVCAASGAPPCSGDDDLHIVGVGHSMGGCVLQLYVLHSLALHRDHGMSKCVRMCHISGCSRGHESAPGGAGWSCCPRLATSSTCPLS